MSETNPGDRVSRRKTLENDFLRVRINSDGSLRVTHKPSGRTYDNLGYFEDGGDAGDTYDYSHPERDTLITSRELQAKITLVERGPLMARFRVEIELDLPDRLTRTARAVVRARTFPIISYVELTPKQSGLKLRRS
jgi:hypothetical protein